MPPEHVFFDGAEADERGARCRVEDVRLELHAMHPDNIERVLQQKQLRLRIHLRALKRWSDP
jgi:hypothetical protein